MQTKVGKLSLNHLFANIVKCGFKADQSLVQQSLPQGNRLIATLVLRKWRIFDRALPVATKLSQAALGLAPEAVTTSTVCPLCRG